ncbi:hypothetical protein RESH_02191 [Rhodopirellula europaea SH398]|uniref:Uncharacterized protein n=1 Tax=Rhodopirellula europaea SH398 TaxID=1263868 RepID=M5SLS5_9BACT|nr:hypothetical protein RESH_02191 [Rhodopirellula europaea SH398]
MPPSGGFESIRLAQSILGELCDQIVEPSLFRRILAFRRQCKTFIQNQI